jgi:hypothetical protein
MPFRVLGALAIVASTLVAGFALSTMTIAKRMAEYAASTGTFLPLPPQEFLERARISDGFLFGCAFLATFGGVTMLRRRPWGMYLLIVSGVLIPTFPWLTHLLPRKYWFYGPDLTDFLFAGVLLLIASVGFMFRPRRRLRSLTSAWSGHES